jgi:hypothetical protein
MLTSLFPAYMKVTRSILKDLSFPIFSLSASGTGALQSTFPTALILVYTDLESPGPVFLLFHSVPLFPLFLNSSSHVSPFRFEFLTSGPEFSLPCLMFFTSGVAYTVYLASGPLLVFLLGPCFLTSES